MHFCFLKEAEVNGLDSLVGGGFGGGVTLNEREDRLDVDIMRELKNLVLSSVMNQSLRGLRILA